MLQSGTENFILPVILVNITVIFQCPLFTLPFHQITTIGWSHLFRIHFGLQFYKFVCIHHRNSTRYMLHGYATIITQLRLTNLSFLCSNDNNTIRTTGTVNSRSWCILQNIQRFNIRRVDSAGNSCIFYGETINHIKRRVILCQRVVTTNHDVHGSARRTFAGRHVHTGNTSSQVLVERADRRIQQFIHICLSHGTGQVFLSYFLVTYYYYFIQYLRIFFQYDRHRLRGIHLQFFCGIANKRDHNNGFFVGYSQWELTINISNSSLSSPFHLDTGTNNAFTRLVNHSTPHEYLGHSHSYREQDEQHHAQSPSP